VNFDDTVKLAVPEDPLVDARISVIIRNYMPILFQKIPNFRYHGNKDRLNQNFNDTVKLPDYVHELHVCTDTVHRRVVGV